MKYKWTQANYIELNLCGNVHYLKLFLKPCCHGECSWIRWIKTCACATVWRQRRRLPLPRLPPLPALQQRRQNVAGQRLLWLRNAATAKRGGWPKKSETGWPGELPSEPVNRLSIIHYPLHDYYYPMPKDARCETNYFNHNLFIFVSVYSMCFRGLNESAERQVTVNANVTTAQRENITDIGQQFASFSYP